MCAESRTRIILFCLLCSCSQYRVANLILPKTMLYSQRLHISKHLLLYGHECRDQCLSHEHAAYYFTHADGQHEIEQPSCQVICIRQNKWHYYCIADDRWNRAKIPVLPQCISACCPNESRKSSKYDIENIAPCDYVADETSYGESRHCSRCEEWKYRQSF